jgi:hypothetical protein
MVPSISKFLPVLSDRNTPKPLGFLAKISKYVPARRTEHMALRARYRRAQKRSRAMKHVPARMMSGAALLLLAAAPASAGHSSRAEIEATRQLNLQAAQQAQVPQQAAQQIAVKDAAANVADNTPPAAAPTAPIQSAQMAAPTATASGP